MAVAETRSLTLTLPPELGGTCFGPFPQGSVLLGTDGQRCAITLGPSPGLFPVHCSVTPLGGGLVNVQSTEQRARVYVVSGRGTPRLLQGAAQLREGDSFALGSPEGARFIVGWIQPEQAPSAGGVRLGGRGLPTADAMGQEMRRQAEVQMMRQGSVQQGASIFYRLRSGAYFQPRYIISAGVAILGALASLCAGAAKLLMDYGPGSG